MRRFILILGVAAALPSCVHAAGALSSVREIRHLSPAQVASGLPVELDATVTYYEPAEHILFVQDKTGALFVRTHKRLRLYSGTLVHIRGVTGPSYSAVVISEDIQVIGTAPVPGPSPATFPQLMAGKWDCSYVTVSGRILSATLQQTIGAPFLLLEVLMDGGTIDVHVENPESVDAHMLLDSQVMLTGVSGGRFDGKFQLVGAVVYLNSPAQMRILAPATTAPESLPLTPMGRIMTSYNMLERSRRVRVRGSVTLYEPGSQLVIENAGKAALVHTHQNIPLDIGSVVYATGFADDSDYSQSLNHGQFMRTDQISLISPRPTTWDDAISGEYAFNLISIEGRLIEHVREANQDTLFIDSGGHVFSAVLRHPGGVGPRLPAYATGSYVRVSGVCFVGTGGPWNGPLEFELHLRGPNDVRTLAMPSWWTVAHLMYLTAALVIVFLAALIWGELLRRRVHQQTALIRRTMEDEAERERRQAFLEKERGRGLEAINSRLPLEEVLSMITGLIAEQAEGLECWYDLACDGPADREKPLQEQSGPQLSRREILSGAGEHLGSITLAGDPDIEPHPTRSELLEMGVSLAALAIDNRRLYEGLIQRSQYDQLTEVPNRFFLQSRLHEVFAHARLHDHSFALIYIDLDRFKTVNDRYGHRIGDIYLQNVARRLLDKLRDRDTLARVGGDEFIVLIPLVRDRVEAEEIGWRLTECFSSPFRIEGHSIEGSASIGIAIYPEDGEDEDQLQRVADAAMYASKQRVLDFE